MHQSHLIIGDDGPPLTSSRLQSLAHDWWARSSGTDRS